MESYFYDLFVLNIILLLTYIVLSVKNDSMFIDLKFIKLVSITIFDILVCVYLQLYD